MNSRTQLTALHHTPASMGAQRVDFNAIVNDFAGAVLMAAPKVEDEFGCLAHSRINCDLCAVSRCECDYDAEGDPLEYVKCSHYCPVHDDCECCGEVKGVRKDPSFPVGKRAGWVCQRCFECCNDCGNHVATEGGHLKSCSQHPDHIAEREAEALEASQEQNERGRVIPAGQIAEWERQIDSVEVR